MKEPMGVDFGIQPAYLTQEETSEVSDFIREYKLKIIKDKSKNKKKNQPDK